MDCEWGHLSRSGSYAVCYRIDAELKFRPLLSKVAFPYDQDFPAHFDKVFCSLGVPFSIAFYLHLPKFSSGFGPFKQVAFVPVPKAPMNKYRGSVLGEDQVGRAREAFLMEPES